MPMTLEIAAATATVAFVLGYAVRAYVGRIRRLYWEMNRPRRVLG